MTRPLRSFFSHPLLLCSISFIICFILGLLLSFPLDPFVRQLEQQALQQGIKLELIAPRVTFPPGVAVDQVESSAPALPHPPLLLTDLTIKPLWSSLIGANPGIKYELDVWQGTVNGKAFRNGELTANLSGLNIDEPLGPQLPLRLSATLTSGSFDGILPLVGGNNSQLQVKFTDLKVSGLKALGSNNDLLPLGELICSASGKGPKFDIKTLQITGPAVDLNADGILHLGPTPSRSIINLNVTLSPKTGLDPWLRDMLSLLPTTVQGDGSYRFKLLGNLSAIRLI